MEVLERYGSDAQKAEWLEPLLEGEIRSAYAMTEPDVASSDATNISTSAVLDNGEWLVNGEKTYISGAGDERCKVMICMVKTSPENARHAQHSQILIPMDAAGVDVVRGMQVFASDDAPHGHMNIRLTDVRVPEANIILGPGRGFEVAQGRLGPGRVHHCMRAIGMAERALELMCRRAVSRTAFGKPLAKLGGNYDRIADARMNIDMARLLTLQTAHVIDTQGVRVARTWISKIKATVPSIAIGIIDDAIQMHGAAGLSQDFPLAAMYTAARTLRLADGPDEVHRMVVARDELGLYL
jgi:acyl-CoA dehydrogenase